MGLLYIIEDDRTIRMLCTKIAEHSKLFENVHAFEDARVALKALESARPSLVLTDLQMKIMDGARLLEKIADLKKESSWYVPIHTVLMTGRDKDYPLRVDAERFVSDRSDTLTKPFAVQDFLDCLKKYAA